MTWIVLYLTVRQSDFVHPLFPSFQLLAQATGYPSFLIKPWLLSLVSSWQCLLLFSYTCIFPPSILDKELMECLAFFTCCDRIPPWGFSQTCTLNFSDTIVYPSSSTCGFSLTLPTKYDQYNEFRSKTLCAFTDHGGFGLYWNALLLFFWKNFSLVNSVSPRTSQWVCVCVCGNSPVIIYVWVIAPATHF
jgi:hypothetical protein